MGRRERQLPWNRKPEFIVTQHITLHGVRYVVSPQFAAAIQKELGLLDSPVRTHHEIEPLHVCETHKAG